MTEFEISIDPSRKLLIVTFRGHWTVATTDSYAAARKVALADMAARGCQSGDLLILLDRREQGPQGQDVVARLQDIAAENNRHARRIAVLVSSALHKRQIDRINSDGQAHLFDSEPEALAWLMGATDR